MYFEGVTSVEWPSVLNDLKLRHGEMVYCLKNQVAVFVNNTFIGGDKELKEYLKRKYTYHLSLDYRNLGVQAFVDYVRASKVNLLL